MDPTIGYVVVAVGAHLIVHMGEAATAQALDVLRLGLLAIDLSATGQLVIRINLDTLRMVRRGH